MRLEYTILLERLEERAIMIPDGTHEPEEMSSPPSPSILDETLNSANAKLTRNGLSKRGKKGKIGQSTSNGSARAQRVRDPDLPKRPTNAYLIFCEMEKERIKQEIEAKTPGVVNDLSKTLTEAWKNLGDEERKPYYKLYEDDRDRYQREMVIYNQKKQTEDPQDDARPVKRQKFDTELLSDDIADDNTSKPANELDEETNNVLKLEPDIQEPPEQSTELQSKPDGETNK